MKAAVTFMLCTVPHFTYFTTTKRRSSEFQSCFVQNFPVGPSWSILISALHDAMQANVNDYSRSESSKLLMHWDDRGLYEAVCRICGWVEEYSSG